MIVDCEVRFLIEAPGSAPETMACDGCGHGIPLQPSPVEPDVTEGEFVIDSHDNILCYPCARERGVEVPDGD
jgi:hypothetical protein